jgi:hypothetical protein
VACHFWQIAVRAVTDMGVIGHGYGGGKPAAHMINAHLRRTPARMHRILSSRAARRHSYRAARALLTASL